jgi:hypothetical protein
MNRGDRRKPIFKRDADRVLFLGTLAETCRKTGWQVPALCLMPNHFHLVLKWIGKRLNMGTPSSLANLLRDQARNENMRLCGTDPFDAGGHMRGEQGLGGDAAPPDLMPVTAPL